MKGFPWLHRSLSSDIHTIASALLVKVSDSIWKWINPTFRLFLLQIVIKIIFVLIYQMDFFVHISKCCGEKGIHHRSRWNEWKKTVEWHSLFNCDFPFFSNRTDTFKIIMKNKFATIASSHHSISLSISFAFNERTGGRRSRESIPFIPPT